MKNYKILGLDTSTKQLAIALAEGDTVLWEVNYVEQFKHIEKLFILIQKGLKHCGWTMDDVDILACGSGPGSFTGLRVGFAAVKGFATAKKKKIVAASSLDIIAHNCIKKSDCAVIVNAHRGKIYGAFYTNRNGAMKKVGRDLLLSPQQLVEKLKRNKNPLWLCGDALEKYSNDLKQVGENNIFYTSQRKWYPCGSHIIHVVQDAIRKRKFLLAHKILPQYLRLSGAEEVKKKKK
ncbi:MAG: tRNA (adenosine(37)-N6)-threonylcarbamoyltransferase complex dimerization subunit type 1 TsaB [Candidatus Omnitrophica bacterium]|nr:tRNA (adenosine(37)-N6)-threonylcarbamoyltransferase complex dimerization subunit type 1 TsaB [Candidatus Omnitrophota bacterium]